jgi:hypothetical protein
MAFYYPLIKMLSGLGLLKNTVITVASTGLYTHYGAKFAKIRIVQVMRIVCANSQSRFTEQEYFLTQLALCSFFSLFLN